MKVFLHPHFPFSVSIFFPTFLPSENVWVDCSLFLKSWFILDLFWHLGIFSKLSMLGFFIILRLGRLFVKIFLLRGLRANVSRFSCFCVSHIIGPSLLPTWVASLKLQFFLITPSHLSLSLSLSSFLDILLPLPTFFLEAQTRNGKTCIPFIFDVAAIFQTCDTSLAWSDRAPRFIL